MAGNSIGQLFRLTTCGESHGSAYMCIVDGCPPNMPLCTLDIQKELDLRRPGQSSFTTQRKESDQVEIISGVFEGKTTGTPIGMIIKNTDQRSRDYSQIRDIFRLGHADYTYQQKYGIRDYRGGGRASARETMMRVAAGAIAKKYLATQGIAVRGYLAQIGAIKITEVNWESINKNPFFCPDMGKVPEIEAFVLRLIEEGNSVGAKITVVAEGMIPGLGEPVFDRLDAEIAHSLMSINAVKGVEIGDGFLCVEQLGTEHRDTITPAGFQSNHAGGTLGGISSGQPLHINIALKPTSSIKALGQSINKVGDATTISVTGRHDPCVGIRATPIAEAMVAITLIDHLLRDRAQNYNVNRPILFNKKK